jgi:hypothetical protein
LDAIFSPLNQFANATGVRIDTWDAFYTNSVHALFDAGMHAAEQGADTVRTIFASTTVATRQWFSTGAFDWAVPVAQYPSHGRIPQSLPIGMALAYVSSPELAVDSSKAWR